MNTQNYKKALRFTLFALRFRPFALRLTPYALRVNYQSFSGWLSERDLF
jgi:hypothetical protein